MMKRVQAILENASFDVERQVAPREIWFDEDGLDKWYEDRMELRKQQNA